MKEHIIQQNILAKIGSLPWLRIWRNNTGAVVSKDNRLIQFGLKGSADIIGLMKPEGRFLAIEVKTDKGRQSEQQKLFQRMIEDMGGLYILARSVDDVFNELLGDKDGKSRRKED